MFGRNIAIVEGICRSEFARRTIQGIPIADKLSKEIENFYVLVVGPHLLIRGILFKLFRLLELLQ